MNTRKLLSRILGIVGGIAMLAGAVDPLEGSLAILPGSGLVALGIYLSNSGRDLRLQWLCIFLMIAVGIGALFVLSAWGFGGVSKHSMWWGMLILPYPIGWIMGIVSLMFELVRRVRHRHAV